MWSRQQPVLFLLYVTATASFHRPTSAVDAAAAPDSPASGLHRPPAVDRNDEDAADDDPRDDHQQPITGRDRPAAATVRVRQCEPHDIDVCRGLGYNVTGWPNLVGHDSLVDAEQQLRTFTPLVQYGCGSGAELRFFLCAVYVPLCAETVPDVVGPCRPVCERVRRRCEPILQQFGFPWPSGLDCSRFPVRNGEPRMCMDMPQTDVVDDAPSTLAAGRASTWPSSIDRLPEARWTSATNHRRGPSTFLHHPVAAADATGDSDNRTSAPCRHSAQRCCRPETEVGHLVDVWMAVLSTIGIVSAVFAVLTFCADARRYDYVERVAVMMTVCSAVCAVALLSSVAVGRCPSAADQGDAAVVDDDDDEDVGSYCTVIFVVVFYFSSAGAIWWMILDLIWTMTVAVRVWTEDTVRRLSTWFHLAAWSTPAVLTVVVLVRKDLVVDDVSGLCRVGGDSESAAGSTLIVVVPLCASLVVGTALLGVGVGVRCWRRRPAGDTDEEEIQEVDCSKDGPVGPARPVSARSSRAIGYMAAFGAVALISLVAVLSREFFVDHQNVDDDGSSSSSTACVLVKMASSVLIAVVSGPWLLVTGRAVDTWRQFVVRRRRRWRQCSGAAEAECGQRVDLRPPGGVGGISGPSNFGLNAGSCKSRPLLNGGSKRAPAAAAAAGRSSVASRRPTGSARRTRRDAKHPLRTVSGQQLQQLHQQQQQRCVGNGFTTCVHCRQCII